MWATGFRPHYPWLQMPVRDGQVLDGQVLDGQVLDEQVLDEQGAPVHREGVTAWPGLYFLGLPWQRDRGSSVLGWVSRDARVLAERLTTDTAKPGKSLITS